METTDKCDSAIPLYQYMRQFGWKNEKKLVCLNFSTTGRGLCSKTGTREGDLIVRLPLEAMITIATLENDEHFCDLANELLNFETKIPFQSLLALYILFQKHTSSSTFQKYIESIPLEFSNPYFCNTNELFFLPEIVLQQTVDQNGKIRKSFAAFQSAFGSKNCPCCGVSFKDIFTLDSFRWAYFAVNSRCVFVNDYEVQPLVKDVSNAWCKKVICDRPNMALAPFLDLFNHSDSALTEALIEKQNDILHYKLVTNNSYEPYEQIFISYGNFNNLKLFTEYGFSLEENSNEYFEIRLVDIEVLIKTEPKFRKMFIHSNKFKYIRDHNLNDQMFIHVTDGLSHNLQVVLYMLFKDASHFPNVLHQTAFGSSVDFEESVQEEAKLLCLSKIKEYQEFVNGLTKLNKLSCAGRASVVFLQHSMTYLQRYLDKIQ